MGMAVKKPLFESKKASGAVRVDLSPEGIKGLVVCLQVSYNYVCRTESVSIHH